MIDGDHRVYYLGDANYNVTALVGPAGTVVERYAYSAYGKVTVYDSDWSNPTATTSSVGNATFFAGREFGRGRAGFSYNRAPGTIARHGDVCGERPDRNRWRDQSL